MGLRAAVFRIQDFLGARAHRRDLPYLREALALEEGCRLLDIGGGTGAFTAQFARGCEETVVLEPDPRKVAYGARRRPHLQFLPGRAEAIPFPDGHFDRVVAIVSLHHVADPDQALEEVARVLSPAGRFIVEEFDPHRPRTHRLHALQKTFGGGSLTFFTPTQLERLLESHELRLVDVQTVGPGYLVTAEWHAG